VSLHVQPHQRAPVSEPIPERQVMVHVVVRHVAGDSDTQQVRDARRLETRRWLQRHGIDPAQYEQADVVPALRELEGGVR
jgi:hypothetical protein